MTDPTLKELLLSKELEPKKRWIVYDNETYYPHADIYLSEDKAWGRYNYLTNSGLSSCGVVIGLILACSGDIVEEDE